jgi:hypothetical protein
MDDRLRSFLLWISVPLCLALAATGLQVFWPGIYARETPMSVAGARASDILNLCLVLPVLVISTILARRGSLNALFVWSGALGFLAYNFVIYVFAVHFNAMFLVYCAVLGLSFYGLVGVREYLATEQIANAYRSGAPRRLMAVTFILLALGAVVGEVKENVMAIRAGQVPASIEAGQLTNPIHALDLCFLLPAMIIAGVMLLRRRPMAFTIAPILNVVLILISIEVVTIMAVSARRGLPTDASPVVSFGVSGVVLTILLVRYLRAFKTSAYVASEGSGFTG